MIEHTLTQYRLTVHGEWDTISQRHHRETWISWLSVTQTAACCKCLQVHAGHAGDTYCIAMLLTDDGSPHTYSSTYTVTLKKLPREKQFSDSIHSALFYQFFTIIRAFFSAW